jgi:hypothetical protein
VKRKFSKWDLYVQTNRVEKEEDFLALDFNVDAANLA